MSRDNDSASSSLSPAPAVTTPAATGPEADDKDDDDSSMDEHQPPPAPAVPHLQTFGDDPSTFPDPTIYEIRPVTEGMSDDLKREIYSVAVFPKHSLEDMIPGPTPDMDYSNAKPSNQVQFNTFSTYIDPYFRPFTEEDLAFLRERGDRVNPYIIPRRGKRHYTEVWAEEDGSMSVDGPQQGRDKLPLNQPRGTIDQMDDNAAETDQISAGPVLSRLLATLRPEHRAPASEEKLAVNGFTNGESSINGELNGDLEVPAPTGDGPAPLPSATQMPGSSDDAWKKATHPKLDYAQVDERIKQELRHIGFLPPDTEPDYDAHYDDETAQRLRVLQEMLKARAIKNGTMKARLMDLTREQMAHQEYSTILEDLDDQVKTAYLKRNRTLGKSKKAKKPGGAGGGSHFVAGEKGVGGTGMARPGLGDVTKSIMEKRKKWIETIGGVLDPEAGKVRRSADPGSGIFGADIMKEYERKEIEAWDEAMEEE
jgi:transcriptional adapter 3